MADEMSLNEALDAAQQMRNHFRAFERLDALLLSFAEKQQAANEADRQKKLLLAEIPTIQSRVDTLLRDHETRMSNLEAEYTQRRGDLDRDVLQYAQDVIAQKNALALEVNTKQLEVSAEIAKFGQKLADEQRQAEGDIAVVRERVTQAIIILENKEKEAVDKVRVLADEHKIKFDTFKKELSVLTSTRDVLAAEIAEMRRRVGAL